MKQAIPLAALVLLAAFGAQAQSTPPNATGPYLVLETSPDVLSVLAVGSRARTGEQATLTWILLKNPPAASGAARTDIDVVVDCARKALQQKSYAVRRLNGEVIESGAIPGGEWMPLRGGRIDQAYLALACDGAPTGETQADLDRLAADWRAQPVE